MKAPRIYTEAKLREAASVELGEAAAHHASRVLRLREGDRLTLFNGSGGEWEATIASATRTGLSVQIKSWCDVERESPLRITLVQGVSSGEKMDFTVQKAVELGVAVIQPLLTQKSVVRLQGERAVARVAHWRRVAITACEQCGRNRIPEVGALLSVEQYCHTVNEPGLRLLLSPAGTEGLRQAKIADAVTLAAGPESGFSDAEEAAFERARFTRLRLGPRVLRTETAALAALAALNALRGDF